MKVLDIKAGVSVLAANVFSLAAIDSFFSTIASIAFSLYTLIRIYKSIRSKHVKDIREDRNRD